MDRCTRKGQANWNIITDNGSQRELVGFATHSRVRYGEAWRCIDLGGIPARTWYRKPMWIKLETEPPIMYSISDLAQAREGFR